MKDIYQKNFSKNAKTYDAYANLQKISAHMLLDNLPSHPISSILDLGCGTGLYTEKLCEIFKKAHITAIDFAPSMIEYAKQKTHLNVHWILSDIETYERQNQYDLITSNACFHWLSDLSPILKKYKATLSKRGTLLFSYFGPQTFYEWQKILSTTISAARFQTLADIQSAMKPLFPKTYFKEILVQKCYPSLLDLLKAIKYTGTKGAHLNMTWSPTLIRRLEASYIAMWGEIRATYQIFCIRGML